MTNLPILFEKVTPQHLPIILGWLDLPHVQEFWDNSPEHRADLRRYADSRQEPSAYYGGIFDYWIGFINNEAYCFMLTSEVTNTSDLPDLWRAHLSHTGTTYSLDFTIGNPKYLGQGYAAPTLEAFTQFIHTQVDPKVDTFMIDPDQHNPRAKHVYKKAGFTSVGTFVVTQGTFKGHTSELMIKRVSAQPKLIKATRADYPVIQNMARFYVYDMSRTCGYTPGWECPEDGLFESFDFKSYFTEPNCYTFLILVGTEKAGFVLINKLGTAPESDWNMGEFFILAKFQGQGVGQKVINEIFHTFPGKWEISVLPQNARALSFWRAVISRYTDGKFTEVLQTAHCDPEPPYRYILSFETTA